MAPRHHGESCPRRGLDIHVCPETWKERPESSFPANWQDICDARRAQQLGLSVQVPAPVYADGVSGLALDAARQMARDAIRGRTLTTDVLGYRWEYPMDVGVDYPDGAFPKIRPVRISETEIVIIDLPTRSGFSPSSWPLPEELADKNWHGPRQAIRDRVPVELHQELDRIERDARLVADQHRAAEEAAERQRLADKFGGTI